MTTAISQNTNGTFTIYSGGKKVASFTGVGDLINHLKGVEAPVAKPKKQKPKSRAARWGDACGAAVAAIEELQEIKQEFEDWKDNLPENLQQSALGEKLETVCDIDLDSALEAVQEAENADLPMGFGRD